MKIGTDFGKTMDDVQMGDSGKAFVTHRIHLLTDDNKHHFIINEIDGKIHISVGNGRIVLLPFASNGIIIKERRSGKV